MNTRNRILLTLIALLITSFTARVSFAQSVTLSVEFGNIPAGGGECVGRGVCDCDVASSFGINVTFSVSADGNSLIMQFSKADLQNSQPEQVSNFTSGYYIFDGTYVLPSSLFSSLNLGTNANINPNSNGTVTIDGDVVTVYETIYTQN